jgi:hypothetical protein
MTQRGKARAAGSDRRPVCGVVGAGRRWPRRWQRWERYCPAVFAQDNGHKTKNDWRNLAIAAEGSGALGLFEHNPTIAILGGAGALYALNRYEKDRKSQSKVSQAGRWSSRMAPSTRTASVTRRPSPATSTGTTRSSGVDDAPAERAETRTATASREGFPNRGAAASVRATWGRWAALRCPFAMSGRRVHC